ncbi:MAG: hypothetical protein WDO56_20985 [Gammaproteobacteria bacterium]
MTASIRTRLLITLLALATSVSLLAGWLTYRQALAESSTLFDYQLRQMALSLRNQISLAPRIEVPPEQGRRRVRRAVLGCFRRDRLSLEAGPARHRSACNRLCGSAIRRPALADVRTGDYRRASFRFAQPVRVRDSLARSSALRVAVPVLLLIPILGIAIIVVVGGGLMPLKRIAIEVQHRDVNSLAPVDTSHLPQEVAPLGAGAQSAAGAPRPRVFHSARVHCRCRA